MVVDRKAPSSSRSYWWRLTGFSGIAIQREKWSPPKPYPAVQIYELTWSLTYLLSPCCFYLNCRRDGGIMRVKRLRRIGNKEKKKKEKKRRSKVTVSETSALHSTAMLNMLHEGRERY